MITHNAHIKSINKEQNQIRPRQAIDSKYRMQRPVKGPTTAKFNPPMRQNTAPIIAMCAVARTQHVYGTISKTKYNFRKNINPYNLNT